MKNPRIAVVGTGYWGKNLVRNFHALDALSGLFDTDAARVAQVSSQHHDCRTFATLDAVLADNSIDAVAIATPAEQHGAMVRSALLAGKDVFVEKPLCLSAQTGQELVSLARRLNRVLMVGHLLWYHPAVLKLKELIDDGELGRIEYVYSNRLNLGKIRREENILWSFAPHDISVILGLLNETPVHVQSQGGNYLHERVADVTVSMLAFASGVKAHLFVSWLHPFKEQKLVIVGDKQMAVFDDIEPHDKLVLYPHSICWKDQLPVARKAEAVVVPVDSCEPLRSECEHFLECIRQRVTPRTDGEEGLRVLKVLDACQSALTNSQGVVAGHPRGDESPDFAAHESAFIDKSARIGKHTKIWHVSHVMKDSVVGRDCSIGQNVVIGPRATVGNGVKIQNNVCVYEGVTLEDHVFCGPSMVFTNVFNPRSEIPRMQELRPTLVKQGATLGANCTIVCGNTIGRYALVGAGSVVTKDVPDYAMVVGNPARFASWICSCGEKLSALNGVIQCACGHRYQEEANGLQQLTANLHSGRDHESSIT